MFKTKVNKAIATVKTSISTFVMGIAMAGTTVFANEDPTQKLTTATEEATNTLTTYSSVAAVLLFVVGGMAYMLSDGFAMWAKKHMVRVVVGYVLVVMAAAILGYVVDLFQ